MNKSDTLDIAHRLAQSDANICGAVVHSLMLTRGLSKLVTSLDELTFDPAHRELAIIALNRIGFGDCTVEGEDCKSPLRRD